MSSNSYIVEYPELARPTKFTQASLGWVPWITPPSAAELTERQRTALVDPKRANFAYFRLLSLDPAVLEARTKTDNDIFYNTIGGLPRAERELAATATSRTNGCVFCASVHSRFAAEFSQLPEEVQELLDAGTGAELRPRWRAIVNAAVALTQTPVTFGSEQIAQLNMAGLDRAEVFDLILSAAFFNWANRLMLSLGEPEMPRTRQ